MRKNKAAAELGRRGARKRWAAKSEEERQAHALLMVAARQAKRKTRWTGKTDEEKRAHALLMVKARQAKRARQQP